VGPAALERLAASLDLAELIALESALDEDPISNPAVCERLLRLHFSGASRESFCCLLLNGANRLIGLETLFCGTVDGAAVYPRVVVERALRRGAAAVIAAHNHPSGQLTPSQSDIRITERLRSALALVDIRLLDHLIVGSGRCVSLAERGYC
jgi:DNA repair protein RadC